MKLTNAIRDNFVDDVMADVPWKDKFDLSKLQDEVKKRAKEALPEEIKGIIGKYPQYFSFESTYVTSIQQYIHRYRGQDIKDVKWEDLLLRYEAYKKECEQRDAIRIRVREIAYSVTTANRLREVLPDLAEYVPEEAKANRSLPVCNNGVVKDLKSMGWSKDKK